MKGLTSRLTKTYINFMDRYWYGVIPLVFVLLIIEGALLGNLYIYLWNHQQRGLSYSFTHSPVWLWLIPIAMLVLIVQFVARIRHKTDIVRKKTIMVITGCLLFIASTTLVFGVIFMHARDVVIAQGLNKVSQHYWYCWDDGSPKPHHYGHYTSGDHYCTNEELRQAGFTGY